MLLPCHVDDKQPKSFTTNDAFRGLVLILGHHHTNSISYDMVTAQYWLVCQGKFDNKLLCMIVMITVLRWRVGLGGAYSIYSCLVYHCKKLLFWDRTVYKSPHPPLAIHPRPPTLHTSTQWRQHLNQSHEYTDIFSLFQVANFRRQHLCVEPVPWLINGPYVF